jgi:hypothetical protein
MNCWSPPARLVVATIQEGDELFKDFVGSEDNLKFF